MFLNEDINRAAIYDDHRSLGLGLLCVRDNDLFLWFIDDSDEFESDLILEVDTEMS